MKGSMEIGVALFFVCFIFKVGGVCEDINTCVLDNSHTSNSQFCSNYEKYLECMETKSKDCNSTTKFIVQQTRENAVTNYNKAPYNCEIGTSPGTAVNVGGVCEDINTCVFDNNFTSYPQFCSNYEKRLECMEMKSEGCNSTTKFIVQQTKENAITAYNKAPYNCEIGRSPTSPGTAVNVGGACEDINTCVFDNSFTSYPQFCSNYEKRLECMEMKSEGCNSTTKFIVQQTKENAITTYNKAPYNCEIGRPPISPGTGSQSVSSLTLIVTFIILNSILWR